MVLRRRWSLSEEGIGVGPDIPVWLDDGSKLFLGMERLPDGELDGERRTCIDCGDDDAEEGSFLCAYCEDTMRRVLQIPTEKYLSYGTALGSTFGKKWTDFTLDVVWSSGPPQPWHDPTWPRFLNGEDPSVEFVIELWRQDLTVSGSALRLIRGWRFGEGMELALRGLETIKRPGDTATILGGAPLFTALGRRGRPPGSVSIPDFPKRLQEAYATALAEGRTATQNDIAADLDISRSTLVRHLRRFSLKWPPTVE